MRPEPAPGNAGEERHGASGAITPHPAIHVTPDPTRLVIRPFAPAEPDPSTGRADRLADRVMALSDAALRDELYHVIAHLAERHRDIEQVLMRRFEAINGLIIANRPASAEQAQLIGAYFSEEYAFEAGAVLNPSIVAHPDQSALAPGATRFILSLRSMGEGDVSSITFRTGTWSAAGNVRIHPASPMAVSPRIEQIAGGMQGGEAIRLHCDAVTDLSEIVIFPITPTQRHGIEDLRLVPFVEEDGRMTYLGTCVAFSGSAIRQELLRTEDFVTFDLAPVSGEATRDKGLVLFPRRIGGRYAALSRKDHENIWFVQSDDLQDWSGGTVAVTPQWPWEFVQLGNCGAPIEIAEGWLLVTHGVGPVRNYCLGACLLDRDDPGKVLARTVTPLLRPSGAERDGYVPNVIYSCGALLRDRELLLPYGVADSFTAFATVNLDQLLDEMR
ncbi:MAG: glycoside hydrolase family 130 protein [Sphingomonas sp.]|jgi:predicted GH43/DUF377 family glycosyl hydrolase|uniref:glycoside hydrolase family 130 protein n=1 Tax=Sphingomonas sp. TaxID=28214 RepID=UPI0035663286